MKALHRLLLTLGLAILATLIAGCGGSGTVATPGASAQPDLPAVSLVVVSPATPLAGIPVNFLANATGTNLGYTWNFGDGSAIDTTSGYSPTHTFTGGGSYAVKVTVTDTRSQRQATASLTVVVEALTLPVTISSPGDQPFNAGQVVNFASSYGTVPSTNPATNLSYDWSFGDGSSDASVATPGHIFNQPGTYVVTVIVTDGNFNMGKATKTLVVSGTQPPLTSKVIFTDQYASGLPYGNAFTFSAQGQGTGVLQYAWDFGDGNTGTGQNTNHTFGTTGAYTVTVVLRDGSGHTATYSQVINAVVGLFGGSFTPPSITGIAFSPSSNPLTTQTTTFTAQANGSASPFNYSWDFGDGSTTSAFATPSTTHVYAKAGSYVVKLVITDSQNNSATATATVAVITMIPSAIIAGVLDSNPSSDGTGTAAQFSGISGVVTDSNGNTYVADTNNNIIRKVTATGVVTTIAGTATGTPYYGGNNSCVDKDGMGAAAVLCSPSAITLDTTGTLYVAEATSIRTIAPDGKVGTIKLSQTLLSPGGIAVGSGSLLYVTDTRANAIYTVDMSGNTKTFAGKVAGNCPSELDGTTSTATFCRPYGIAVASDGSIFVADTGGQSYYYYGSNTLPISTIRKISADGTVSTLAGNSASSSTSPYVPACSSADGKGSQATFCGATGIVLAGSLLYVTDMYGNAIRSVSLTGQVSTIAGGQQGMLDGVGSTAAFNSPLGISTDGAGNFYIADNGNNLIRKMTASGAVTTLAGNTALTVLSVDGIGSGARMDNPQGIASDSNGNIYVIDAGSQTIRKISMPGATVTSLAGSNTATTFYGCSSADGTGGKAVFCNLAGITVASNGTVYVTDGNAIRSISPNGTVSTLAGVLNSYYGGTGYCGYGGGAIDGSGSSAQFCAPQGITMGSDGNIYVVDTGTSTIRKVTPAGTVTTIAGSTPSTGNNYPSYCYTEADGIGTQASFCRPTGIAGDSQGNLFVTDTSATTIRKVTLGGVVTTLAGKAGTGGASDSQGAFARFYQPTGIAIDGNTVYVTDNVNGLRAISSGGMTTTVRGLAFPYGMPTTLALLPDHTAVFPSGQTYSRAGVPNVIMQTGPLQ